MSHYSAERKEVILKQLLPPHNRTVTEVSAHEGISTATLYNWRNKAKLEGVPVPGRSKSSEDWSGEAKLAVVVETIALSHCCPVKNQKQGLKPTRFVTMFLQKNTVKIGRLRP